MFDWIFSGKREALPKGNFEEGRKLFERGMAYASQYRCSEAIECYTQSIAACPNPAPYINRANILGKRVRHYEALQDLLEARRLDVAQSNEFSSEIKRELARAELLTHKYRDGFREKLIADYKSNDKNHVALRIMQTSFAIEPLRWEHTSDVPEILEFHFFNELDNVAKFDELEHYPDVKEFIDCYPESFIQEKVNSCPNEAEYWEAEIKLHSFLCSYDEGDMQRIRNGIIYDIHCKLMERDFGGLWMALSSDCRGITKEAEEFMGKEGER